MSRPPVGNIPEDQPLTWIVETGGQRVDRYLAEQVAGVSRAELQRWIKEGRVTANGKPVKSSHKLAADDIVLLRRPVETVDPWAGAEAIPLDIVYEDDDLLVVNKAAGMVVHPAPGHEHGTLAHALVARYPHLGGLDGPERAGIVHRLDRETSGLLLIAKTHAAQEALKAQFKARSVQKTYLALVEGYLETPEGRIEAPIGRNPVQRKRMAVISARRRGRPASTSFRVLGHYLPRVSPQRLEFTLLELDLHTGRTHQIRVHLAFIKHPVVGDRVYGRRRQRIRCPRQFLHAARLVFTHPTSGAEISVEAPLPADLQAVLANLMPDPG